MSSNKILFFCCLSIFTSCEGQAPINTKITPISTKAGPTVLKKSKSIGLAPDFDTTLVSQYIRSIFQDSKGNLWFGTIGEGVVRYDGKTLTYFSNPDGFISQSVFAINEDKNGNLWFGTDQGIYKYDGKAFKSYNQKDGLSYIDISRKSILVDKSGSIWIGTHHGVFRYNPDADNKAGQSFSLFNKLPPINVAGIMEDKMENIWFATDDKGIYRYDGKTISHIADIAGMGGNYAGGMAEDKAGNLWFTMKGGICKYDGKNITTYDSKDGLAASEIWGIYIEESGIIWITARGSTTRFDPAIRLPNPGAFTVYTVANGINCCVQSMFQDRSGKMWWGTGQGLYRFDGSRFYQVKQAGPW